MAAAHSGNIIPAHVTLYDLNIVRVLRAKFPERLDGCLGRRLTLFCERPTGQHQQHGGRDDDVLLHRAVAFSRPSSSA